MKSRIFPIILSTAILILFYNPVTINGQETYLNSAESFIDTIPQKSYAFLVGNSLYPEDSSFGNLEYCRNDVLLMESLFVQCCKIPSRNIYKHFDITLETFNREWERFQSAVEKDALVILYFSSHGEEDGSIILSDTRRLSPGRLREMVNSYTQDTVLFIDACYSGEGENAPGLMPFKENSIRLYSSLGFSTARELEYGNSPFFKRMQVFYKEVLGLEEMDGNGYFTALIADFFGRYRFGERQNASFYFLFNYITGRGKEHLEYIAGPKGGIPAWELKILYESRLPKIEPLDREIPFNDPDHLNLVLKKRTMGYRPAGNYLSLSVLPAANIPLWVTAGSYDESGLTGRGTLHYNFNFKQRGILGIGLLGGYRYMALAEYSEDNPNTNQTHIPMALSLIYYTNSINPIYICGELNGGPLLFRRKPHSEQPEYDIVAGYEYRFSYELGLGLGAGVYLPGNWGIALKAYLYYSPGFISLNPGITINKVLWEF